MEPAVLKNGMDIVISGTAREAEGLCSKDLNMALAVQGLNLTLAIQNHNGTADMDNLGYNMDVHSLASSTSPREECPDMDDYDQTLMELGEWEPFGANVDQPVEAALDSGTALEDAGSKAVGVNMDRSVDAAIGSSMASGDAGSQTGSRPGPFQQPPLSNNYKQKIKTNINENNHNNVDKTTATTPLEHIRIKKEEPFIFLH